MKPILKNWATVAVAALGVGAFASASQAGSVVNLIHGGVPFTLNTAQDESREGFWNAAGNPQANNAGFVTVGDTIRGYFDIGKVNSIDPVGNQGVQWTAVFQLKVVSLTQNTVGGQQYTSVVFGPDSTFGPSFNNTAQGEPVAGLPTSTEIVMFQSSTLNANANNPAAYSSGQFFWGLGKVSAGNAFLTETEQPTPGGIPYSGYTSISTLTEIARTDFAVDVTGFNASISGLGAVVGGLVPQTYVNTVNTATGSGDTHTVTGQFNGFSKLLGSSGAVLDPAGNFNIVDNSAITFAVFAPAPEAFWGGAALLGSVAAARLLRRRTVAC